MQPNHTFEVEVLALVTFSFGVDVGLALVVDLSFVAGALFSLAAGTLDFVVAVYRIVSSCEKAQSYVLTFFGAFSTAVVVVFFANGLALVTTVVFKR